jgi:hypothetical protein
MDQPDERLRMGIAGRRRIDAELAWCYSARSMLSAYAAVATHPERTAPPCAAPAEQDRC